MTSVVLIVDDNPTNIDVLLEVLQHYDLRVALDGESSLDQVKQEIPDLILLDVSMPGMDGYEVCKIIKSDPKTKNIPILFLSANADVESIVKGFASGGVDYITKPYRPKEVLARVKTHLKLENVINELEKLVREDPLTGIANRRHFFETAQRLLRDLSSDNFPMYLFSITIDKLQDINNEYGHEVGNEVIKIFAKTVKKHLDKNDYFARLGGPEFTIVMPSTPYEEALKKAKLIEDEILEVDTVLNKKIRIMFSMGMAEVMEHDNNIDAAIGRADENLEKDKTWTRNKIRN